MLMNKPSCTISKKLPDKRRERGSTKKLIVIICAKIAEISKTISRNNMIIVKSQLSKQRSNLTLSSEDNPQNSKMIVRKLKLFKKKSLTLI